MSDLPEDLREAKPTFSFVREEEYVDQEWCFKKFRLNIGVYVDQPVALHAIVSVPERTIDFKPTPAEFTKALWLAKAESEEAAYAYLLSLVWEKKQ